MCKPTITAISQEIARNLSSLMLIDASTYDPEKSLITDQENGLSAPQQAASIIINLIELLNIEDKNEKDLMSIKSIFEITCPQLLKIINTFNVKFRKAGHLTIISTRLEQALAEMNEMGWIKLRNDLLLLCMAVFD